MSATAPAILAPDRGVPGLGVAMNRESLIELLAEQLPECRDGIDILDARPVDVQYAPGERAQVLWKLNVHDRSTDRTGRQLVFAKALGEHESAPAEPLELVRRYGALRAQKRMSRDMPLRTPWLFEPRAHVLVHAFPLDPQLPRLLDVADPEAMKEALHRAWQPRGVRVRRVRIDTLSYTPEARAALRYEVLSEDKNTRIPELRRLVGKIDARRSPTRLFAGHWAVWRRAFGRVSVAPPVGYVAVSGLSLQEFLTGTRLADGAGQGAFIGYVRETARAIANIHALTLPVPATRGVDKEMSSVDRWIGVLTRIRPAQGPRLERLGHRLRNELAQHLRVMATVHGDFHLANVLADEHGVTLIDWDQVAHGDPMVDVGRVLASLRVSSLRIHGTLDGFADVEESFLRTYLDATGDDERRARLFESVALLVAAAAPFRLQRQGWEHSAELMIDEVERVLDVSCAGRQVAIAPAAPAHQITFAERRFWALDAAYAQALLVPIVHGAFGGDIEVTECAPKRQEAPRDRLHVRWSVKGYRGSERWRGALDGVSYSDDTERRRLRRLEIATAALADHPNALRLPRPLGHLGPLSMTVFTPVAGRRLLDVLNTDAGPAALRCVAAALATFHALTIDVGRQRETRRDVATVRRRLDRLSQAGHADARAAAALFDRLHPTWLAAGERRALTPRLLELSAIMIDGERSGLAVVDDLACAEPLVTAGSLVAQLAVSALEREELPAAAGQFRDAYVDASGCSADELHAFAALALLSQASQDGVRKRRARFVRPIVDYAASLIPS
jgi:aminoglycoside phosphotransferase (APT) family kinase protein